MLRFRRAWPGRLGVPSHLRHTRMAAASALFVLPLNVSHTPLRQPRAFVSHLTASAAAASHSDAGRMHAQQTPSYSSSSSAARPASHTTRAPHASYAAQLAQTHRRQYYQHLRALRREVAALHASQEAEAKLARYKNSNKEDTKEGREAVARKAQEGEETMSEEHVFVSEAERQLMAELGITDLMTQQVQHEEENEDKKEKDSTTTRIATEGGQDSATQVHTSNDEAPQRLLQQCEELYGSLRPRIAALCHAGLRARFVPTSIVYAVLDCCTDNTTHTVKTVQEESEKGSQAQGSTRMTRTYSAVDFTDYLRASDESRKEGHTAQLARTLFGDDVAGALLNAMTDYVHYTRRRMQRQELHTTLTGQHKNAPRTGDGEEEEGNDVDKVQTQQQQASSCYAYWQREAERERLARQLLQLFQPLLTTQNTLAETASTHTNSENNNSYTTPPIAELTADIVRRQLYIAVLRLAAVLGEDKYATQVVHGVFTALERTTLASTSATPDGVKNGQGDGDEESEESTTWPPEEVRAMCLSVIDAVRLASHTAHDLFITTSGSQRGRGQVQSTAFAQGYALLMRYMQWRRQTRPYEEEHEESTSQQGRTSSGSLHDTLLRFPAETMAFIAALAPCVGRSDDIVSLRTLCDLYMELLSRTDVGYVRDNNNNKEEEDSESGGDSAGEGVTRAYGALLASIAELTAPFAPHDMRRAQLGSPCASHVEGHANSMTNNDEEDACSEMLESLVRTTLQNTAMHVSQDTRVTAQLMRVFAHGGHCARALLLFNKLAAPASRALAMREEWLGSMVLASSLTPLSHTQQYNRTSSGAAYVSALVSAWRESFARYVSFRAQHYALTSNVVHSLVARLMLSAPHCEESLPQGVMRELRAMVCTMLDDCSPSSTSHGGSGGAVGVRDLYAGRTFFLRCLVLLQSLLLLSPRGRSKDTTLPTGSVNLARKVSCEVVRTWHKALMSQSAAHLTWPLVHLLTHLSHAVSTARDEGKEAGQLTRVLREMEQDVLRRYVRRFTPRTASLQEKDENEVCGETCLLEAEELETMCQANKSQSESAAVAVTLVHNASSTYSAAQYMQRGESNTAECSSFLRDAWRILVSGTQQQQQQQQHAAQPSTSETSTPSSTDESARHAASSSTTTHVYVISLHEYAQLRLMQTWLARVDSVALADAEQALHVSTTLTSKDSAVRYRVLSPEAERVLRSMLAENDAKTRKGEASDASTHNTCVASVTWEALLPPRQPLASAQARSATSPAPYTAAANEADDGRDANSVAYWLREWLAYHNVLVSQPDFFARSVLRGLRETDTLQPSQTTMNMAEAEAAYAALAKDSPFVEQET